MDARALVTVLQGERARFVRLARRRVRTEADAEDVVQRALARAAARAAQLDDPSRALAWFHRILRNAIADDLRTGRGDPMRHCAADADVDALEGAHATAPARTPCACTMRLLSEMRPAYAEVLRRVDVGGEDARAVARALGISLGNLQVRLHRARKSLRDDVHGYCGVRSHRACLDCTCDATGRCGR